MVTINKIYDRLLELINHYEYYLSNNEALLNIIIDNSSISFYLNDDELILAFQPKEEDALNYLGVKIITKIYANVLMHLEENRIYNKHKKVNVYILDEKVLDIVRKLILIQEGAPITTDDINKYVKAPNKIYPNSFDYLLKERIAITKKYLN